jgi:hypothetical protein
MKVLVATRLGQGLRAHDFCTTLEGELIVLPPTDVLCEFHMRAAFGAASGGETTTFMVVDRPELDRADYREFVADGLRRLGFESHSEPHHLTIDQVVEVLLRLSMTFTPGTVLERAGGTFAVRLHRDWTPSLAA